MISPEGMQRVYGGMDLWKK